MTEKGTKEKTTISVKRRQLHELKQIKRMFGYEDFYQLIDDMILTFKKQKIEESP